MRALLCLSVTMIALLTAAPAQAACVFQHKVTEITALNDLPTSIRAKLPSPIAAPGERFNASDNGMPGFPNNGVLLAGRTATHWFVWIGQGSPAMRYLQVFDDKGTLIAEYGRRARSRNGLVPQDESGIKQLQPPDSWPPPSSPSQTLCVRTDLLLQQVEE